MNSLSGMTILDLTRVVAGPYCGMILADLGARVIKVENPGDPDYTRQFEPYFVDGDKKFSGFFAQYNRNKEAITLNLKDPEGKKLFFELVKKSDVVLENYRGGIMDKLGCGYSVLKEINPKIVYTAISGYGQYGPYAKWPAYDNSGQALSGLWSMNGTPGNPVRIGTIIGDLAATFFGAIGMLAAYNHAQKTGQGQMVDVAQLDSSLGLTEIAVAKYTLEGLVQGPLGNDHPFIKPYGMFEAKGGHVFFGGYTNKFWSVTCDFFGEPEFAKDPEIDDMNKRFKDEVYYRKVLPKIKEWFSKYTPHELQAGLGPHVPCCAIQSIDQVLEDPQLAARGMFIDYTYGSKTAKLIGNPIKLSETPCDTSGKAPEIGENNEAIYQEFAGLSPEQVAEYKSKGVI